MLYATAVIFSVAGYFGPKKLAKWLACQVQEEPVSLPKFEWEISRKTGCIQTLIAVYGLLFFSLAVPFIETSVEGVGLPFWLLIPITAICAGIGGTFARSVSFLGHRNGDNPFHRYVLEVPDEIAELWKQNEPWRNAFDSEGESHTRARQEFQCINQEILREWVAFAVCEMKSELDGLETHISVAAEAGQYLEWAYRRLQELDRPLDEVRQEAEAPLEKDFYHLADRVECLKTLALSPLREMQPTNYPDNGMLSYDYE